MNIGEQTNRTTKRRICMGCGIAIKDNGLCSFGCTNDAGVVRPAGTVMVQVFESVDTLVSQEPETSRSKA